MMKETKFAEGSRVIVNAPYHAGHGKVATVANVQIVGGRNLFTVRFFDELRITDHRRVKCPAFDEKELELAICPVCEDRACEVKSRECGK